MSRRKGQTLRTLRKGQTLRTLTSDWTSWAGFGPGTRTSRGVVCTMWARPPTPATACLSSSSPPGWSVKESWRTWDHLQMRCNHQVLFFSLIALPTPAFDRGVKAPPWGSKRGREGIAAAQETRDLAAERDRIDHHHWHRLACRRRASPSSPPQGLRSLDSSREEPRPPRQHPLRRWAGPIHPDTAQQTRGGARGWPRPAPMPPPGPRTTRLGAPWPTTGTGTGQCILAGALEFRASSSRALRLATRQFWTLVSSTFGELPPRRERLLECI